MNERRSTPSSPSAPDRRHRRGSRGRRGGGARRRRGVRSRLLLPVLAAGAVLVLAGGLALREGGEASADRSAGATGPAGPPAPSTSASASARPGPRSAVGTKKAEETEKEREKTDGTEGTGKGRDPGSIPSSGPGTFATAGGGGDRVGGSGRTLTYVVQVEDGIGIPAGDVAAEVERILADERGWTADGIVGFRRVSGGASDFRVRLATAGTVDTICGRYGLDTGGEVNCNVGQDVMVNLKRWLLATQYYADDVTSYRALIINHEVGHFLGHGHEGCPGAGRPAPVMMQQIKGLHGCRTNVWPYDSEGRPITGPAVG
ncbi:DUF3152 domain-containing protein [Streptomyces sp. NPDC015140]|uniref:DUF3152 domain-containing protein n=1 Tax=Streptomyces sp. NPDC015140 TaxID=3364943 RepID=UPI0036FB5272